ncbi:MAG: hypothetical protein HOI23_22160 [Deltaproteobacteria bacterium]|jgi:hypothetical protein|nr:hypothetical protein [Deltaproteobacteria bacterium]MBT6435344.1 hypothetical protein [Deltaproteobacteria bacterium]MBT6492144.1 hypothetical protein [Deltaproteobacteria bacterium]
MKTQYFQWILLAGCVSALGWQHTKIGALQESLSAQGIQTGELLSSDKPVRVGDDFRKAMRGGNGRMRALENRIAILENRGPSFAAAAGSLEQAQGSGAGEEEKDQPQAMPQAVEDAFETVMSNPRASERLRDMIREEQAAASSERRDDRQERRRERVEQELEALNEMLDLSGSDADTLNDAINSENEAVRGFWGQVRSGDISWAQARKATRMRRTETDTLVRDLLDENKLVAYETWRDEQIDRQRKKN